MGGKKATNTVPESRHLSEMTMYHTSFKVPYELLSFFVFLK